MAYSLYTFDLDAPSVQVIVSVHVHVHVHVPSPILSEMSLALPGVSARQVSVYFHVLMFSIFRFFESYYFFFLFFFLFFYCNFFFFFPFFSFFLDPSLLGFWVTNWLVSSGVVC